MACPHRILIQDAARTVCWAPAGTVATHHTRQAQFPYQYHCLYLQPHDAWYNALVLYDRAGQLSQVYCNVALPPEISPGRIDWVDLDLDVSLYADGSVELLDEDEFAAHTPLYGYPQAVVEGARAAARLLLDRAAAGADPFYTGTLPETLARLGCTLDQI